MFRRKLAALGHSNPCDEFTDYESFKRFVIWLEDQKIRHYKIEDRAALRQTEASDWLSSFIKYLADINCPIAVPEGVGESKVARAPLVDWLLGFAVRLEYGDNVEKYRGVGSAANPSSGGVTGTLLDNVDFNSEDFKAGVASLAKLLQIPPHPDHLVVLEAVSVVVTQRLTAEALERKPKEQAGCSYIPLDKVDLGFDVTDPVVKEAAKILRLMHIQELRDLQNLANEAIVAVQALTANPKTDSKLGKVGS